MLACSGIFDMCRTITIINDLSLVICLYRYNILIAAFDNGTILLITFAPCHFADSMCSIITHPPVIHSF